MAVKKMPSSKTRIKTTSKKPAAVTNNKSGLLSRALPNKIVIGAFVAVAVVIGLKVVFLSHAAASSGLNFNSLTPARIADTRPGSGLAYMGQTIGAGQTLNVQVTGKGGVPISGASAVVVNLTAASASAQSFLTVYPTGLSLPNASVVNTKPGQIANNQATVKLGTGGQISIHNESGNTNVIVDVLGYYGDTGAAFIPMSPARIADTRSGSGQPYAGNPLPANGARNISVSGAAGVPASAMAVTVNVTIVTPAASGYLIVYPGNVATPPNTSNANFVAGEVIAKQMTLKLGTNGQLSFFNGSPGSTNIIVDVLGYYASTTTIGQGQEFTSLSPARITDTRTGSGQINTGQHLSGNGVLAVKASGAGGVPAGATAVIVNLTSLGGTSTTFLTTYPTGTALPNASSINNSPGQTSFNEVTVKLGSDGGFNIYNAFGSIDVIVDVVGYYSPSALPTVGILVEGVTDLSIISPDLSSTLQLTKPLSSSRFRWSTNSNKLFYTKVEKDSAGNLDYSTQSIHSMNIDGTNDITIRKDTGFAYNCVTQSPDGSRLAYSTLRKESTGIIYSELWLSDSNGGNMAKLPVFASDNLYPSIYGCAIWSPNSTSIAYVRNSSGFSLWTVNASTHVSSQLTPRQPNIIALGNWTNGCYASLGSGSSMIFYGLHKSKGIEYSCLSPDYTTTTGNGGSSFFQGLGNETNANFDPAFTTKDSKTAYAGSVIETASVGGTYSVSSTTLYAFSMLAGGLTKSVPMPSVASHVTDVKASN